MRCSNLPDQLSTFIGREREIATATRLLHGTRLLTLTGSGGSGKTRLALAVAEKLVRRYQDGVWFVDLASISNPDLAPQASRQRSTWAKPRPALIQVLAAHLRTKRILLLLDNCEHMVAACAQLAYALLTAAPGLRVLATSREPLHVPGETTWPVPPLGLPELGALPRVEELARVESIRLFVERAGRITPGFTLNERNALPISQICYRLAGSPLAIELAAARTRVLSPAQIAARLGNALSLLATDDRTVPSRHRTLQATLDWSYGLLSQSEQSLFRCLSVFAGSFSVEAAEAVCDPTGCDQAANSPTGSERGAGDRPPHSVLDLLAELADKSLLEVEPETRPERRYRYLAPVRLYALAKLEGSGEAGCARDRLLRWSVTLAEKEGPGTYRGPSGPSIEQLEVEHPNLRAALEWGQLNQAVLRSGAAWQAR
jgi:predicted ATPase